MSFRINYDNIVADKRLFSITRKTARTLQDNPYMMVQSFLEGISDEDLEKLLQAAREPDEFHYMEVGLLAEMLARAEGVVSDDDEELSMRVSQMVVFLTAESLARSGLLQLRRENISFGDDVGDLPFAKAVDRPDS